MRAYSFDEYIRLAFDLVRESAADNPAVLRRLLRALALVARHVRDPDRLRMLREQAELVLTQAQTTLPTDYLRQQVQEVYDELSAAWA